MALIFSVDPGNKKSAFVIFDPERQRLCDMGIEENDSLLRHLSTVPKRISAFAIEMIASFGFTVGKEIFDTCFWIGRFYQAVHQKVPIYPVFRKQVVVHHTGKPTGGDPQIRAAMIRRFGKENLAGCKYDIWSALSIAAYVSDKLRAEVTDTL